MIGSAALLGNPVALLDRLGGGVMEFFRAPAEGFISDGLIGLGLGFQKGLEALVLGAATHALAECGRG